MKMRERVGLNLQNLRRARGLSQEALALMAEIDRTYVGKIENGKYSVSVDVLEQLSKALDIDTIEFFRPR
ncbi:XRE family transcriptional regulator [Pseudorhodobacter sp. E13]|uniref:helix-turn-helix domain-containing protein n=1 Tax=Pseudorhodobacter sp. E13 TaxID=2487931 RepID=UPI000F8C6D15|nr:helix-turn-helix transcriptional regulator [Pseudorhodobacter sp. E13]RUS65085.1 XRE family transcriptional regulator [Pseudorhodobacter sp. E13]